MLEIVFEAVEHFANGICIVTTGGHFSDVDAWLLHINHIFDQHNIIQDLIEWSLFLGDLY